MEISVTGELRADGSGVLHVSQMFVKDFVDGELSELAVNRLFPTDEASARDFVEGFTGTQLLSVAVNDAEEMLTLRGRKLAVRRLDYSFSFQNINAISTNHVRFAYYPYEDDAYFQFRIDKAIDQTRQGRVNPMVGSVTKGQNLSIHMDMPGKVLESNGGSTWGNISWQIPIKTILDDNQESIVAWAKMPTEDGINLQAIWNQFAAMLPMSAWRDPVNLPSYLIENPEYLQTIP